MNLVSETIFAAVTANAPTIIEEHAVYSSIQNIRFTDCILDQRAGGYRATPLGGPKHSNEMLAEFLAYPRTADDGSVQPRLIEGLARILIDDNFTREVLSKLLPVRTNGNPVRRLFEGTAWLTFQMVLEAVVDQLKVKHKADAGSAYHLAAVMASILTEGLRDRRIMLPSSGMLSIHFVSSPIPSKQELISGMIATHLADILDTIRFSLTSDDRMGGDAMIALMLPTLHRAGNDMLALLQKVQDYEACLGLLRAFMERSELLPTELFANHVLMQLSANMTLVMACLNDREGALVGVPPYRMASILEDFHSALLKTMRFRVMPLSAMKDLIAHAAIFSSTEQRVIGLAIGRVLPEAGPAQVTSYFNVGTNLAAEYEQVPADAVADRLSAVLSAIPSQKMSGGNAVGRFAEIACSLELKTETAIMIPVGAITLSEIEHYAAAFAPSHTIVRREDDSSYMLGAMVNMPTYNWKPLGQALGSTTLAVNPANIILSCSLTNAPASAPPARPQSISRDFREFILYSDPIAFTASLARKYKTSIKAQLAGDAEVTISHASSVRELLHLPPVSYSMTESPLRIEAITGYFSSVLQLAKLSGSDDVGQAGKIALGLSIADLLIGFLESPAGSAFVRAIAHNLLIAQEATPEIRATLKGAMRTRQLSYTIGLNAMLDFMVVLGLLPEEMAEQTRELMSEMKMQRLIAGSMEFRATVL